MLKLPKQEDSPLTITTAPIAVQVADDPQIEVTIGFSLITRPHHSDIAIRLELGNGLAVELYNNDSFVTETTGTFEGVEIGTNLLVRGKFISLDHPENFFTIYS